MKRIEEVLKGLIELSGAEKRGISAIELSQAMKLDRATISRYLNDLFKENRLTKIEGRPVLYKAIEDNSNTEEEISIDLEKNCLDSLVGANASLQIPIQQAKAAIFYPPNGLHTLILGETGVGKSMFAEAMYGFAKESKTLSENSPFVRFNCADYSENPQLLISQIFGVKKGAFTGADKDRDGLLKQADGGIIFLDEIHRLSPQGQEMLFTFIDKGKFRPLGESEKEISVKVQIIAATTEEPKSYLLKTFTRRIPMTITLPPLKERTLKERYELLEEFIKNESLRLSQDIYFDKNALISFLLYECTNNIGQLKSDIQLACAKAFLNYKSRSKSIIMIEQQDLQSNVKRGIMRLKDNRSEIEELFNNLSDIISFSYKKKNNKVFELDEAVKKNDIEFFYNVIEEKVDALKKEGLDEGHIKNILNVDIDEYFKKYMSTFKSNFRKAEILKIVDEKVLDIVEKGLDYASEKLNREYDEKIYYGLALHMQGSIERIRNGNRIYHPKLNYIKSKFKDEFMIAMDIAKVIEDKFGVDVTLDEIGYITMFLKPSGSDSNKDIEKNVGVLVIMHGKSTATSMVEVANTLIGEEYVEALDMPLTMKAEVMLERVKKKVIEINQGKGVIILADMGSLVNFGDILKEETGIDIRTIDMVSTITAIEVGRKALCGRDIDSIYRSCRNINIYSDRENKTKRVKKELAIVTTCFTGEGSAERLRSVIEEKIYIKDKVRVIPIDIMDKERFLNNMEELKKDYTIVAIVGTVNMYFEGVPFISAVEVFTEEGINRLNSLVSEEIQYINVSDSLKSQIKGIDSYMLVEEIKNILSNIEGSLNTNISSDVKLGIVMHICFLIDKLKNGGLETQFIGLNEYKNEKDKEFTIIKGAFKRIEMEYNINIGDNEIGHIVRMVLNDKQ
ncbi:sigma 54-interacting transcriptional regulator [Clostridium thermobutyricum]|uniref:sigma 54-interacting transcriptional regulator n=1 Tax=Clostridium thermobutyricum TaxID=29372 RepID=UPI0018AAD466|nr:sigma-54-dependent transcriptional regulator [Clostridium thermobutyricum]